MSNIREVVANCSGAVGPGDALFDYWQNNNCPAAYSQVINTFFNGQLQYNPLGQAEIQNNVVQLFDTYFVTNELTDDVTSPEFNNFQFTLLDLCTDPTLPGVCEKFLGGTGTTGGYCGQFTREQAINSPTLTDFCGCYVPPDPTYLALTVPPGCTGSGCTGNPACDPLCRRSETSQKANNLTGEIFSCPQTICVIDDVIINANKSRVAGGINFNTVCSGCGGADGANGCLCIVSGTNVSVTAANVGLGANFNDFCGTGSICLVEDDQGNIVSQSSCQGVNFGQLPVDVPAVPPRWGIILLIVVAVILVLVIAIAARFYQPQVQYPSTVTEI